MEELAVVHYGKDYKANPKGDEFPIYGTGGIMGYTSLKLNSGPAILSGRKGSINNPLFIEGDFWNVDTIFCVKPREGIVPKWLYYNFINTDLTKLNEATGVPSVSASNLYRLTFKYFDYSQQKK
ncbi:restriction endonuclease subunit S [Lacinutrix mariniflava]|uniref:restriction endonuclease subunit S n=1 Tax=Lacinutrix mariniflava TaxID=342955 RepID=UPI001379257C|nr:restriction endonuclease subunit S [Lacinutrix mariniflava]